MTTPPALRAALAEAEASLLASNERFEASENLRAGHAERMASMALALANAQRALAEKDAIILRLHGWYAALEKVTTDKDAAIQGAHAVFVKLDANNLAKHGDAGFTAWRALPAVVKALTP